MISAALCRQASRGRFRVRPLARRYNPFRTREQDDMTFLRWAGSKKQIVDTLACCWYAANDQPAKSRYIEAFSGSAALFFHVRPERAILIDINRDLQECMSQVKSRPRAVHHQLTKLEGTEEQYYKIRAQNKSELTPTQRAARFIYLNRYCFNGLYRTNSSGAFNVPFGGSARNGVVPTLSDLLNASKVLGAAELSAGDFFEVVSSKVTKNDFVYMDPPYAKRNTNLDNQYGPDVFGTSDIARLTELAALINKKGASFVISYADCEEIDCLRSRWTSYEVSVKRSIAANAKHRGLSTEVLITNI